MSKKKLKLNSLTVQSFVTSLDEETNKKVKGGTTIASLFYTGCIIACPGGSTHCAASECALCPTGDTCDPCSRAFTNCVNNGCNDDGGGASGAMCEPFH